MIKPYDYIGSSRDLNPGLIVELHMHKQRVTPSAVKASCNLLKWSMTRTGVKKIDDLFKPANGFVEVYKSVDGNKRYYGIVLRENGGLIDHVWA